MKKNEQWIGTCQGYTFEGLGVVKEDGFVYFVKDLLDGETAKLAVTSVKKNFGYARIVELLEPSIHRKDPKCSVYRQCGGCQLMHMDEEEQASFKENKVKECFKKNAHMDVEVLPILTSEHVYHYRNKVQVPVQIEGGNVKMGFYRPRSNEIVEYDNCLVQTDFSNDLIASLKVWMKELHCPNVFRHILIKHAHSTNQAMVCLIVNTYPFDHMQDLVNKIQESYDCVKSILVMVNQRNDNVILDGPVYTLYGNDYIEEELLGLYFKISAYSFFQINPYSTELLYQKAIDFASIQKDDVVVDLYCGTGTIGLLASKYARRVYGIEIVEEAIQDAKLNAKRNGIKNAEFYAMDASEGANMLLEKDIIPDVVIVDPPRKGCSKETIDAILTMSPKRVVYVSCDPSTLARDVAYFDEFGYQLQQVQPVDMFPNTNHVETVVWLCKK